MLFIWGIVYLDMYDVALYIGYSIYLSPVILPHLALYSVFLIFSSIFVASQFSKIIGYFWFNLLEDSYSQKNATRAPRLIGLCYLILALQPTYYDIGIYAFYLFLLIRMIQGFAFGFELAFVVRFANAQGQQKSRRFMFYFIVFAGEIGILVSVFVNRLIISQGWDISLYDYIGYPSIKISALHNTGLEILQERIKDKTTLFSGHSGVGKSTLINALVPDVHLKTGAISGYHGKGMHTTTFSEMIELPQGGFIIDTPGIKGFGTVDMEKNEIFHFFPEIFKASKDCRYNNCIHINEPGCAVRDAVENHYISESRYKSYMSMMQEDIEEKYRK